MIDWLHGEGVKIRRVAPELVCGGGDSAGGNTTAAIGLRRRDEGKKNLAVQMLMYSEATIPFDTPAVTEKTTGFYLECSGIFPFEDHYLPRGVTAALEYISPGMQSLENLAGVLPAVFTSGFDPLRVVGVEYAHNLDSAGNKVHWHHYSDGWLQMTGWCQDAVTAVEDVAKEIRALAYGSSWIFRVRWIC